MCSAHFWKRIFEKLHLEKMACVIFFGDQHLVSGRSPQVVKTKKTRSAAVISFQVVSRRDGCSKVHWRRIWYSIFNTNTYMFGSTPRWRRKPYLKWRPGVPFPFSTLQCQYIYICANQLHPLTTTVLQTSQISFWYVLRESTVCIYTSNPSICW